MKTLTTANGCLTLPCMPKDALLYARISAELKRKIAVEMARRGEAEAVIIRAALNSYFARREAAEFNMRDEEHPAPTPVARRKPNYRIRRKKKP